MQAHIRSSGHRLCTCGGYHYAHRRYSKFCYDNPMSAYWHASRAGASDEDLEDIQIECVLNAPGRPLKVWPYDCPSDSSVQLSQADASEATVLRPTTLRTPDDGGSQATPVDVPVLRCEDRLGASTPADIALT